jgi:hypothetical protein
VFGSGGIADSGALDTLRVAGGAAELYVAGVDHDAVDVHASNGNGWGSNLAAGNFGAADAPSVNDVAVLDGTLYAAVKSPPDYDLQVFRRTGSGWETVGGDANGWLITGQDLFDVRLETLRGALYLSYTVAGTGASRTLRIHHLDGASWATDLEWSADHLTGVRVARASEGDLYFMSRSTSPTTYPGGVYRVSGPASVEALVPAEADWFIDPLDLTVDDDGHVVVASLYVESTESIYPVVNRYDGAQWATLSGDFSNGVPPVDLTALGTDLIYTYGDAASLDVNHHATVLCSDRLSPSP